MAPLTALATDGVRAVSLHFAQQRPETPEYLALCRKELLSFRYPVNGGYLSISDLRGPL